MTVLPGSTTNVPVRVGKVIEGVVDVELQYVDVRDDQPTRSGKGTYSMVLLIGSGHLEVGDQAMAVTDFVVAFFPRKGQEALHAALRNLERGERVRLLSHLVEEDDRSARDGRGAKVLRWRVVGLET